LPPPGGACNPELDVIDEGHLHVGHEVRDGRGHIRLRIKSDRFAGLTMMQRHRLVYEVMGDLMRTDVHALAIEAQLPEESVR
jgi:BolA protein